MATLTVELGDEFPTISAAVLLRDGFYRAEIKNGWRWRTETRPCPLQC